MPTDFSDDKLRVLQATDIVRLIADHLALKSKGRELVGLCPFHDDHRPSMNVVPAKQIFHCFSCGTGGDALTFVMKYHQMSFREALEFLAQRAGIKLTPWRTRGQDDAGHDGAATVSRQELVEAHQFAGEYFRAILRHAEHGAPARALLAQRGVGAEAVERFGLGAAADKWDGLALTVAKKNLPVEPFVAAGLLRRRESGQGLYDGFRHRVMYPITDQLGRVIAFGARRIRESDDPKYLNSPDSILFSKSATLYALAPAAAAIRQSGTAIVTEGYMDTIACHQAGIHHSVAALGTALTPTNAKILSRLCKTVVLLFDGDEAGQRAADRAVEVLFSAPIDVKIATLASLRGEAAPKDPDDVLRQPGGKERLLTLIGAAQDALAYRFARLRGAASGLGVSARGGLVEGEVQRLVELGLARLSPMRRQMIVRSIASLAGVDEHVVSRQIEAAGAATRPSKTDATRGSAASIRAANPPQRVLAFLLAEPGLAQEVPRERLVAILSPAMIANPVLEKVAKALDSAAQVSNASSAAQSVMARLDDPEARAAVTALVAEVHRMTSHEPTPLRPAFMEEVARAWHDVLMARARGAENFAQRIKFTEQAKQARLSAPR